MKRLTAMRTRFEILAAISTIVTTHPGVLVFGHGGELYHPHETLNSRRPGACAASS
jgi:hypothetical protein